MDRKVRVYVGIPYTGIENESFKLANEVTADLMADGYIPFSPISHSHPIALQCEVPGTWDFWEEFDRSFIEWADEMLVIVTSKEQILNSTGVQAEIKIANELGRKVEYYYPDEKTRSDTLV